MVIIKDENQIQRLRSLSRVLGIVGLGALVGGFIFGLRNNLQLQLLGLLIGFVMSQVSVYMANKYLRSPRPDEALDDALRKLVKNGRMYHHVLPVPHVLLTPAGPIIFHAKYQGGNITVVKNRKGQDKWVQRRVGPIRRFFGQEGVGNPTREAEIMVSQLANYIRKYAPAIKDMEVPIGVIIVFTIQRPKTKRSGFELELDDASLPAMHISKLRGYLRNQGLGTPLPAEVYEALQAAFDRKAAKLLDQHGAPLALQEG